MLDAGDLRVLHSSTGIVVARGFDDERDVPAWLGKARRLRGRPPEDGQRRIEAGRTTSTP